MTSRTPLTPMRQSGELTSGCRQAMVSVLTCTNRGAGAAALHSSAYSLCLCLVLSHSTSTAAPA